MKKVKAIRYHAHKYYNVMIDTSLLNMKIRIYDEHFQQTGTIFYEGTIGKFIKERVPTESLVKLLTELKHQDKLSYRFSNCENFIERI